MKKSTIYWIIALVITNGACLTFAALQGRAAMVNHERFIALAEKCNSDNALNFAAVQLKQENDSLKVRAERISVKLLEAQNTIEIMKSAVE